MSIDVQGDNKPKNTLKRYVILVAITVVITFALTTIFSPFSKLYDELWVNKPDTHIYQYIIEGSGGPIIFIINSGKAIDEVRIEVYLSEYKDSIKDINLREEKNCTLMAGGVGNNYVIYKIEELWPEAFQIISIITSSPLKTEANIRAYSLKGGKIKVEEPAVVFLSIEPGP